MTVTAMSGNYDPAASRFLNALMREWGGWRIIGAAETPCMSSAAGSVLHLTLPTSCAVVLVPIAHLSKACYHAFAFPMRIIRDGAAPEPIAFVDLVTLLLREPDIGGRVSDRARHIFLRRVIDSALAIAEIGQVRGLDRPFMASDPSFIDAEQALRFGHAAHPSPRSRDEFTHEDSLRFGPEYGNGFPLRWWAVDPDLFASGSVTPVDAAKAMRALAALDPAFSARAEKAANKNLIPIHPWQAARLMQDPAISWMMSDGLITDLGLGGPSFRATSSLRAVHSSAAPWMLKFSLSLRLTNSRRLIEAHECARGLAIHRLMTGPVGQALKARCPRFHVMGEPAWLALRERDGPLIRETMVTLRENPFMGEHQQPAAVLAALCERHPDERGSHLADLINRIAKAEGERPTEVAERWFQRFLGIAVEPFLVAQGAFGLLFGAHQQNLVLGLRDGWPDALYFRDCQGTGYLSSFLPMLREHLPEAGSDKDHVFDAETAARIVGYYLFVNGVFAVVGALGAAGLADEDRLFAQCRAFLERLASSGLESRTCLDHLLSSPTIGAKGNFMLSLGNVNENTDVTDPLAAYVQLANPLAQR